jgi:nitrogenase molybdenum-iron protein NifN
MDQIGHHGPQDWPLPAASLAAIAAAEPVPADA